MKVLMFKSVLNGEVPIIGTFENDQFEFFKWELNSTLVESSTILFTDNQSDSVLPKTNSSHVRIDSYPLAISCSYNSRFAVAFQKEIKNDSNFVIK